MRASSAYSSVERGTLVGIKVVDKDQEKNTLVLLLFAGTIFCEFLRFGKNRKIKYPQKFLPTYHQAPWYWCIYKHKLRDDFSFWIMHDLSLLFVSAFSFLPSGAIPISKK